jgi:hypothetical protein
MTAERASLIRQLVDRRMTSTARNKNCSGFCVGKGPGTKSSGARVASKAKETRSDN